MSSGRIGWGVSGGVVMANEEHLAILRQGAKSGIGGECSETLVREETIATAKSTTTS